MAGGLLLVIESRLLAGFQDDSFDPLGSKALCSNAMSSHLHRRHELGND